MNRILLHIEGAAVLIFSILAYHHLEFAWLMFFVLLFVPDISMLGYLIDTKRGAIFYNLFHTYSVPIAVIVLGIISGNETAVAVGLIWAAHIGMDRMLGYGLKYPSHFKDTHFNRV